MKTVVEWRLVSDRVSAEQAEWMNRNGLAHSMRTGDTVTFTAGDETYLKAQQRMFSDLIGLPCTLESRTVTTNAWKPA